MAQHSENALRIARFLETHPRVTKLLYPGLESFPQFELARKQQTSGGALIAFEIEGGVEAGYSPDEQRPALCARREPWLGRNADHASSVDDAR